MHTAYGVNPIRSGIRAWVLAYDIAAKGIPFFTFIRDNFIKISVSAATIFWISDEIPRAVPCAAYRGFSYARIYLPLSPFPYVQGVLNYVEENAR